MQTPRIAASSYSNTAPLVWSFLYGSNRGRLELIMDNAPARSAELLRLKRVDAALVPVIEYQRIEDVRLVPDVCVGAKEKVRSVCLVTKGKDLKDIKSIALDVSSKTSVALTAIIFKEFLGFNPDGFPHEPDIEEMLGKADCALLIGDPSLTINENIYRKFDLAETWKSFTGYGFVFAMWMANAGNMRVVKTINFAQARNEGLNHLDEIVANYKTEISLDRDDFKKYLSENISYTIDDSMHRGLSLYFELAHKHRLIERLKPLRFTN